MTDVPQPSVQVEYKQGDSKPKLVLRFKNVKSTGLTQKLERRNSGNIADGSQTENTGKPLPRPFTSFPLSPLPELLTPFRDELPEDVNWDIFNYLNSHSLSFESSSEESEAEDTEFVDFELNNLQNEQFGSQELHHETQIAANGQLHRDKQPVSNKQLSRSSEDKQCCSLNEVEDFRPPARARGGSDSIQVRSAHEAEVAAQPIRDGPPSTSYWRDQTSSFAAAAFDGGYSYQDPHCLDATGAQAGEAHLLKRSNSDRFRRPVKYKSINELTVSSPTIHSSPGSNQDSTAKVVLPVQKQPQNGPPVHGNERSSVRDNHDAAQLARATIRPASASTLPERLEGHGNDMFARDGPGHGRSGRDVQPAQHSKQTKPISSAKPPATVIPGAHPQKPPKKLHSKPDKHSLPKPKSANLEPKPSIAKHRPPQWSPDNMFDRRKLKQHGTSLSSALAHGKDKTGSQMPRAINRPGPQDAVHPPPKGRPVDTTKPPVRRKLVPAGSLDRGGAPSKALERLPSGSLDRGGAPSKALDAQRPPSKHKVGTKRPASDQLEHRPAKHVAKADARGALPHRPPAALERKPKRKPPHGAPDAPRTVINSQRPSSQPTQPKPPQPKPAQPKPAQAKPVQPKPTQPKPIQPKGSNDRPKASEHMFKPAAKQDTFVQHSVMANGTRNLPLAEPAPVAAQPVHYRLPPNTIVWAKIGAYPWWPAQVQEPIEKHQLGLPHSKSDYFVVFYGSADYNWLAPSCVQEFKQSYKLRVRVKSKGLQRAIDEAWQAIGRARPPDDQFG